MKFKLFLVISVFFSYFVFNGLIANASEENECFCDYTFNMFYEYNLNIYNKMDSLKYEIYDEENVLIQNGYIDETGKISFKYFCNKESHDNCITKEIKLKVYPENEYVKVYKDYDFVYWEQTLNLEYDVETNLNFNVTTNKACWMNAQFAYYYNQALIDSGYYINVPKIDVNVSSTKTSNYDKGNNIIHVTVLEYKVFAHEYTHYVCEYLEIIEPIGGSHQFHLPYIKYDDLGNINESDMAYLCLTEVMANFLALYTEKIVRDDMNITNKIPCSDYTNENKSCYIEDFDYTRGGILVEQNIVGFLWDVVDNTPSEENVCITISNLLELLKDINQRNSRYRVYDIYTELQQYISQDDLKCLLEKNYLLDSVELDYNDSGKVLIKTSNFDYYKNEYDKNNDIKTLFTVYDKYIFNIYEKTYNGYTLLESFDFGFVNEEDLYLIDGFYYIEYEFTNEINNFIINNSFKELYYSVEEVNYRDEYITNVLMCCETLYKPICFVINEEGFRNINYIQGDNNYAIYGFNAPVEGVYKMYSTGTSNVMCFVYEDITDSSTLIASNDDRNGDDENFEVNVYLKTKEFVYIKVYFVVTGGSTRLNIELNETGSFLIDSPLFMLKGTEVTLNGGELNSTVITQGYSRIAYIPNGSWPTSRLDYNWYSSNDEVLTVSSYGTLQALSVDSETVVIVTAVNINNPNIFFMQYITVVPDTSNITKEVNINFSLINGSSEYITLNSLCPNPILQSYEWISSDESIAKVNKLGYVTKVAEGETVIYGYYKYNSNYIIAVNVV